jgi:hypothetical protein
MANTQAAMTAPKNAPQKAHGGDEGNPNVAIALNNMAGMANENTKVESPRAEPSPNQPSLPAPNPSRMSANTGTTVLNTSIIRSFCVLMFKSVVKPRPSDTLMS